MNEEWARWFPRPIRRRDKGRYSNHLDQLEKLFNAQPGD